MTSIKQLTAFALTVMIVATCARREPDAVAVVPAPPPPPPPPAALTFPPPPSDHLLLRLNHFGAVETVGDLLELIHVRLLQSNHNGVLFVPVPGGVAVVALPDAKGPGPSLEPLGTSIYSALRLVVDLFRGRPGEHRAVAFVVSAEEWRFGDRQTALPDFEIWERGALPEPPDAYETVRLTDSHYLIAALYLFRQPTVDADLTLVTDPEISVREYLEARGLLDL